MVKQKNAGALNPILSGLTVSVRLPATLVQQITQIAENLGVSRNDVIRNILTDNVKHYYELKKHLIKP